MCCFATNTSRSRATCAYVRLHCHNVLAEMQMRGAWLLPQSKLVLSIGLLCVQAAGEGNQGSAQCYSLAHRFVLEATEVAETPRTTVTLQLLGPHTVK